MNVKIAAVFAVFSLFGLTGPAPASQQVYEVVDLGTLGGAASRAQGINNYGEVVGWSNIAGGARHAFVYRGGAMMDLGTLPGGTYSEATAVSESGQVVGFGGINLAGPMFQEFISGFLWESGTMQPLAPLYCPCTFNQRHGTGAAQGINNFGQAVGWSETVRGSAVHHAVLWQSGTNQDIGAGAGDLEISRAFGINDLGQIVGDFAPDAGRLGIHDRRAFLWQNGVRQDLGTLPGHASGTALDVNQGGQVVGWSGTVDGAVSRAFLWENGAMQDLGTLPGDVNSQALSINTSGQVVGWSGTPDRSSRAFLWHDGEMLDLNGVVVLDLNSVPPVAPGWVFTEATAINDAGQIAGVGLHNGQTRAFLLKPVLGTGIVPARASVPF